MAVATGRDRSAGFLLRVGAFSGTGLHPPREWSHWSRQIDSTIKRALVAVVVLAKTDAGTVDVGRQ